jgi:hypothetical protein
MVVTVDAIHAGNLVLGLGAGWYRSQLDHYGILYCLSPGARRRQGPPRRKRPTAHRDLSGAPYAQDRPVKRRHAGGSGIVSGRHQPRRDTAGGSSPHRLRGEPSGLCHYDREVFAFSAEVQLAVNPSDNVLADRSEMTADSADGLVAITELVRQGGRAHA